MFLLTSVTVMMLTTPLLIFAFLQLVSSHQNVKVVAPFGDILGTTLTSRLGKTIYAFRGIRYAQPPVNELRFKPPVPIEKWSGTYNATVDGPLCPQPVIDDPISDDCLMLNVYSTKLPQGANNPKRPVIIYLHAGGFYSATGRSNGVGPQYFMDQDIVLVTLNYRLASLGFISVGKEAPGNNGLKDQVVAMRWVKNNIAAFGGDPDSVTLYGYSAGAWSITLHMVSPMSRDLFHKGILGSGSALGHWPLPRNQLELAKRQARYVGCPDSSPKEILDCLRTIPAKVLGDSFFQFAEFGFNPVLRWSPVIEEDFGQERFLTEDPIKLIQSGNFQKIPIITGVTKDEFVSLAYPVVANTTLLDELSGNFEKLAPVCFIYERNTEKSKQVSRAARRFYFGDRPLTNSSLPDLVKIYADSVVGFPVYRTVNLLAEKSTKPVYYYEFSYQGRYSFFYPPGTTTPYGVNHHDDLMYSFYLSQLFPFFNQSYPEAQMVETLTSIWANFAKTGKPIPKSNPKFNGIEWEPYNTHTKKYMDIGKRLVPKECLYEERYQFWNRLYPISSYLH